MVPVFLIVINVSSVAQAGCPTDDSFSPTCISAIIPPFPICLKKSAAEWVALAQNASPRCCGEDKSGCGCPIKNTLEFQRKIGGYCDGIESCAGVTLGKSLPRGFSVDEQVQLEEYPN